MGQFWKALYNFLKIWQQEDLKLSTQLTTYEMVFGKFYNACVLVYVPTMDSSYIETRWISPFIAKSLGNLYYCYIT